MASEDDDDLREAERLRLLGLEHLANQPERLKLELLRRVDARKRLEAEEEARLRQARAAQEGRAPAPPAPALPKEPPRPSGRKSSTLLVAHVEPGPCSSCRHANQGTVDFREGHLFCWMDKQTKLPDQLCDVARQLPRQVPPGPMERWGRYFLHEAYDGKNGTYGRGEDYRLLAEDADAKQRAYLKADVPFIPGEGR